jgi:hypothetical protein
VAIWFVALVAAPIMGTVALIGGWNLFAYFVSKETR